MSLTVERLCTIILLDALSSNGRTPDSGSGNLRSNRSRAAKRCPHRLARSRTVGSQPTNWGSNPHGDTTFYSESFFPGASFGASVDGLSAVRFSGLLPVVKIEAVARRLGERRIWLVWDLGWMYAVRFCVEATIGGCPRNNCAARPEYRAFFTRIAQIHS